ncbi:hypothetical protein [Chiayiivirga flava]|uniref:DUF4410 domain-containing protein n=1 Tax=Chiayiivirga flava TaxID=659595 RepID=A0A7W8DAJ9_9GAMM|nr:hypothetical protein [Chiayiivirga flava]MBB5209777.1 hypothetical protein [Chiayiivirga flava]
MKLPALLAAAVLLAGCATQIRPTVSDNPPPTRALNTFEAFELRPVAIAAGVAEPEAVAKIQQHIDAKVKPLLAQWSRGAGATLVLEPTIRELKFVSGGNRVWAGAMAGSSAVRLTVRLTDKASGAVVAEPEFYQRAAAMGGAYSFGGSDNAMLERIASVLVEYLQRNHARAVGGPTGLEAAQPQ